MSILSEPHKHYNSRWDAIGISASFACAIHCIAMPLLFTTLPLFGFELLANKWVEISTVLISVSVGSWALLRGYDKYHRKVFPFILFIAGIVLLVFANLYTKDIIEILLKFFAVSFIITAHILNLKFSKQCESCA